MNNIKTDTIFFHRASPLELSINEHDLKEVFRYAGIFNKSHLTENEKNSFENLALESVEKISSVMNPRSVYIKFSLQILNEENSKPRILFSDKKIESENLALNLKNCHSIFLFAATLGPEVDKLIFKTSKLNPPLSVFLQAAGAMFIEKYCDALEEFLLNQENQNQQKIIFAPRFSPGYGDVPLETQNLFFEILRCQKNLALTLNDSLIMSPEKSVTAFIGVKNEKYS